MAKNSGPGESWLPGVVARQLGPVTYLVDLYAGRFWKRHIDHLKAPATSPDTSVYFDVSSPLGQNETVTPSVVQEKCSDVATPDSPTGASSSESNDSQGTNNDCS